MGVVIKSAPSDRVETDSATSLSGACGLRLGEEDQQFDESFRCDRATYPSTCQRRHVVGRGAALRRGGEPEEAAEGVFEGATPVDAGPVVEHDRHDVLRVRAEVMNEKRAGPSLGLPGEKVQAVSRFVGPQAAPLSAGIIGVDGGRPIAELRRAACSGANSRRRHADRRGGMDDQCHGSGNRHRQSEQGERVVHPQPQGPDREHTAPTRRQRQGRRRVLIGPESVPADQASHLGGQLEGRGSRSGRRRHPRDGPAPAVRRSFEVHRGEVRVARVRHLHKEFTRSTNRHQRRRNHQVDVCAGGTVGALKDYDRSDDQGKSDHDQKEQERGVVGSRPQPRPERPRPQPLTRRARSVAAG